MEEAENICDRVIMINKGIVIGGRYSKRNKTKKQIQPTCRDAFFKMIGGYVKNEK